MTEKEQLEEMRDSLRIILNISTHYVFLINQRLWEIRLEDIRNSPEKYTYWQIKQSTLTDEEINELLRIRKERKKGKRNGVSPLT